MGEIRHRGLDTADFAMAKQMCTVYSAYRCVLAAL